MSIPTRIRPAAAGARPNDHARIMRAMAALFGFVLLAKLAGASKELAIAYTYGVGPTVDAYVLSFSLYHWLPALWFSVLGTVFVPLAARWRERDPAAVAGFNAQLAGHCLWLGLLASLLAAPLLLALAANGAFGLEATSAAVFTSITWAMAPVLGLGLLISLASVRLMAREQHANSLFEGIPALTLLAVLLMTPSDITQAGPQMLVWGTVAGLVLQLGALLASLGRHDALAVPQISLNSPVWSAFARGLGVVLAGEFLMSLTTVVDQIWAARLGTGALSSMGYAMRLVSLALGLATTVSSRAVLPVFANRVAAGGAAEAIIAGRRWAAGLFAGCIVVAALGILIAPWGVALVYERGAFTAQDTERVTELVRLGLLQLPFYVAGTVLAQLLASLHQLPALAAVAAINLLVKLAANALLVPWLGAGGLIAAGAVMYAGSAAAFWWLSRSKVLL